MKLILIGFITLMTSFSYANFSFRVNTGVMEGIGYPEQEKYIEMELGYNHQILESLSVRGSAFGRSADEETFFGFQLSAPISLVVPGGAIGSYLAPGYRYMSGGYGAPVLEGGLNLYFLGNGGVGYRVVLNEWVKNGLNNESQFYVSFGFSTFR